MSKTVAQLAYEHSYLTIIRECAPAEPAGGDAAREWFNLEDFADVFSMREVIADSVEYLESRGLLLRSPNNPNIVAIRAEQELENPHA